MAGGAEARIVRYGDDFDSFRSDIPGVDGGANDSIINGGAALRVLTPKEMRAIVNFDSYTPEDLCGTAEYFFGRGYPLKALTFLVPLSAT